MKSPKMLATICSVLGVTSAIGLIIEYLALCDIAQKPNSVFEWYVVGACMIVMGVFVICALITVRTLSASVSPDA